MFRTIFTFELAYWFKRPLTLLFFTLFFLMAFFSTASDAFLGIAAKGSGNLGAVAPGVAEALITTVGGLAAAIPAVIAYNLYVNRVRGFTSELDGFGNELIGTMAREGLI